MFDAEGSVRLPQAADGVTVFTVVKKVNGQFLVPQVLVDPGASPPVQIDLDACRRVRRAVPLSTAGIERQTPVTDSFIGRFSERCCAPARVLVRVRATLVAGRATRAEIAVQAREPLFFADWRPKRIAYALARGCAAYP